MNAKGAVKFLESPGGLAVAAVVGAVVLYMAYKAVTGIASKAASTAGGVLTGNNALTAGTPYAGAGVAGTLGAGANAVSGGTLSDIGTWLGGKIYDLTHPTSSGAPTGSSTSVTGGGNTNASMGGVNFGLIDTSNSGW